MTDVDHRELLGRYADIISAQEWDRLGEVVAEDAIWEFPQSGERFRGLENIRATFENYPALGPGAAELQEVIGGATYALTPRYTIVAVDGSGDRGSSIVRARYPDGSRWWVVNLYEVRDGKINRARAFFAPEFEPPDWRRPFHDTAESAG